MGKKIISLLLFIMLFTANSAFAFYEAGTLFVNRTAETKAYAVDSRVLFVQDYSKILSAIRESMKTPFAELFSGAVKKETIEKSSAGSSAIEKKVYMMNSFEKFAGWQADAVKSFFGLFLQVSALYVFAFIISFILLYIGLLRLFNAHAVRKNYTLLKPGFTY